MKSLVLPFDFEGKGVLDLELLVMNKPCFTVTESIPAVNSSYFFKKDSFLIDNSFGEPTSVLDSTISGGPNSSSTLSSSHGGGGGGGGYGVDTVGVGVVSDTNPSPVSSNAGGADSEILPAPSYVETGTTAIDSAAGGWGNVSSAVSPSQEQSVFRWIVGDIAEDPATRSLNKVFQIGGVGGGGGSTAAEFDCGGGFGVVDQGDQFGPSFMSTVPSFPNIIRSSNEKTDLPSNLMYPSAFDSSIELNPPHFNLINQHHAQPTQSPSLFSHFEQEQIVFGPRAVNGSLGTKLSFSNAKQQEMLTTSGHQYSPHHLQLLPHCLPPQRPIGPGPNPKTEHMDEIVHIHHHQQQQQTIIDQLYNVVELVETGNFILAQGILARLNQFLSPIGKPFNRAAFYCKEALHLLLNTNNNLNINPSAGTFSPSSLVFKIAAYKSFSEISPLIEFSNFTCNQALLEAFQGSDRIHIVDFDIGLGGQWASLMQELGLINGPRPVLKITALVNSISAHDHLELCLVRENLSQFAGEISVEFEFEVTSIDSFRVPDDETIGVSLPVGCLADYNLSPSLVLRFLKQMSPAIVVTVDRGCDRTDLPLADHIIHALRSYSNLLESVDAVNVNSDAVRRIERFVIQPGIEKIVMGRFRRPEKSQHWRNLFSASGFLPVPFSDFAEWQGECVAKRTPVRGFQVEKRRSSIALCWQRKEVVSVSVWRC
ncbi:hypothetical protein OROMI_017599 [Orobanche minor]